jgi:alcohol dehydrogenase (NADP+)
MEARNVKRKDNVVYLLHMIDSTITSVDPSHVPQRRLYTGATMPAIGLGTFGSDQASHLQVADAVRGAAEVGYRHFDCAAVYGNEDFIGEALKDVMASGIGREELWITSKLWNNKHAEDDVIPAFKQSLADLGLEYLDLYLIHWPFPNHHAKGVDVNSRDHHAVPYIHANYMKTWRQLEKLVDMGLVRHIGTSNMTVAKLELLLNDARIKSAVNEMELHPHFQQPQLFKFLNDNGMEAIAYCPIGSPNRPERDRTPEDTNPLEDPIILSIAQRLNLHPATVCIKWAIQRGQTPIPMSVNRKNYLANLQAAITEPLSEADMAAIAGIDKHCRLIKGQVFLWKENQDWQDLWDGDGVIAQ